MSSSLRHPPGLSGSLAHGELEAAGWSVCVTGIFILQIGTGEVHLG